MKQMLSGVAHGSLFGASLCVLYLGGILSKGGNRMAAVNATPMTQIDGSVLMAAVAMVGVAIVALVATVVVTLFERD